MSKITENIFHVKYLFRVEAKQITVFCMRNDRDSKPNEVNEVKKIKFLVNFSLSFSLILRCSTRVFYLAHHGEN